MQEISQPPFSYPVPLCGDLLFEAQLFNFVESPDTVQGPIPLNLAISYVIFRSDGYFKIRSDDLALLGRHELRLDVSLKSFPNIFASTVVLPLEFKRCSVLLGEWALQNLFVPTAQRMTVAFDEPAFAYASGDAVCNYEWQSYELHVKLLEGALPASISDPTSLLLLSQEHLTIDFKALTLSAGVTLEVAVQATLSDEVTIATATF